MISYNFFYRYFQTCPLRMYLMWECPSWSQNLNYIFYHATVWKDRVWVLEGVVHVEEKERFAGWADVHFPIFCSSFRSVDARKCYTCSYLAVHDWICFSSLPFMFPNQNACCPVLLKIQILLYMTERACLSSVSTVFMIGISCLTCRHADKGLDIRLIANALYIFIYI